MSVSIGEHLTLLGYSLLVGVLLGVLYDAVRLLRTFFGLGIDYADSPFISRLSPPLIGKRAKRERRGTKKAAVTAAVFVFDILYMTTATAVTVIFVYHASSGTPRGFSLLGEAAGFALYMKTVGRLTAKASSYIFFAADTAVRYALFFTVTPVKFIAMRSYALAKKLWCATGKRALLCAASRLSSARVEKYIKNRLEKTLSSVAESIGDGGTEN